MCIVVKSHEVRLLSYTVPNNSTPISSIKKLLPYCSMSIVNVAEVISVLSREGMPEDIVRSQMNQLISEIVPYDMELAFTTGFMIKDTFKYGLSLGDRACIATGMQTLTYWQKYFNYPTGAQLGIFNGTQGLGGVVSQFFLWWLVEKIGRKFSLEDLSFSLDFL